jgi:glutaredoxin domain-containing cysteine-rich protein 1
MGCVSSKLFKKDLREEVIITHGPQCLNHVVSLTSSTYGLLNLDKDPPTAAETNSTKQSSPKKEDPEVINAWELMEGLEEAIPIKRMSPKSRSVLRGFADFDARSPLKLLNQFGSPMKAKRFGGKENKGRVNGLGYSPKGVPKSNVGTQNSCKKALNLSPAVKGSPVSAKRQSFGSDSSRRKSFSPLFDPELVASYEKEMSEEEEQIKRMVLPSPKTQKMRYCSRDSESMLKLFEKKCPPGGENAVVIYTTTLRGIRKTFEDCNNVRSIVESHLVRVLERDISMDSGFKEEIRGLMETKEVRVPLVFVKGRLIGGAEEIVKLEEEGKLGVLFDGIPKALVGCQGCAGMRFVMCVECNGSCKVLDEGQKKMVKCGECNENGLIHCPICC